MSCTDQVYETFTSMKNLHETLHSNLKRKTKNLKRKLNYKITNSCKEGKIINKVAYITFMTVILFEHFNRMMEMYKFDM